MSTTKPAIRTLKPAEVGELLDWAAAEGWNPGLDDAAAFQAADPAGFIGAFVEERMVAGISAIAYGPAFGFIGLYICRADVRGKGYGKAVWDAGMAYLAGRTVGLDGVPQQQQNYAGMGFRPLYETYRWSGRPAPPAAGRSGTILAAAPDLLASLHAFDRRFFPAERHAFLSKWLAPPRTAHVLLRDGDVCGYGVARRCREGYKIGPLFAVDAIGAAELLASLAQACGPGLIHLDVPETSLSFVAVLDRAGMQKSFVTARMYRGAAPAIALEGVFAVTTLELG
ncbi:hypothetical protein SAMN05892877_12225 [Rhizobium subbaraonis]|uniref:N-acetyltransferase domain-containing protein n=1 Tax=Rhizobium subbaraonis TaxID=908946 RepID=A0A285UWR3_9HYPH|nr:GNAT family N-acetyltransferase [Rhizobium subbaraonis]SOC46355.1 hypothetical protein SAMN05892877_12225 [Rhizobium subbaraonis]